VLFHFDNNHVYLEVAGRPRAKKRAAYGHLSRQYNPSKPDELEFASVCAAICSENSCTMPLFFPDSALSVHLRFFLPQSTGDKTKIFAMGDIHNMCKFVLDALNKVMYPDD
jgi:Holliday junction resolvase RusA-like endonuclease